MDTRRRSSEAAFAAYDFLVLGDQSSLHKYGDIFKGLFFLECMLWRELEHTQSVMSFFSDCQYQLLGERYNSIPIRDCILDTTAVCGMFGADLFGTTLGSNARAIYSNLAAMNMGNRFTSGVLDSVRSGITGFMSRGFVTDMESSSGLALAVMTGALIVPFAIKEKYLQPTPDLAALYGASAENRLSLRGTLLMLRQLPSMTNLRDCLKQNATTFMMWFDPDSVKTKRYFSEQGFA